MFSACFCPVGWVRVRVRVRVCSLFLSGWMDADIEIDIDIGTEVDTRGIHGLQYTRQASPLRRRTYPHHTSRANHICQHRLEQPREDATRARTYAAALLVPPSYIRRYRILHRARQNE